MPIDCHAMTDQAGTREAAAALLRWYAEMGVDTVTGHVPTGRLNAPAPETVAPQARPAAAAPPEAAPIAAPSPGAERATNIAANCKSLDELRAAMDAFDGCALKQGASQTVFADGTPGSDIMLIGEAPGREEDRQGKPFVGRSGQLLDRMLAALGLTRDQVYIANILPWRPPLNRKPDLGEIEMCLPFLLRHIELAAPKVIIALGGTAAQHLLGESRGIMALRGKWHELRAGKLNLPVMPTLHPAYLLRTPAQKRQAWNDFLTVKLWLNQQQN
jgi:uracil-DNA glycosylase